MTAFKLDNEPKISSGFKVPDGYFDTLPQKVAQRIDEKPVIKLYRKSSFIYAAAAILVLALLIPFYNSIKPPTELDESTLENYLAYQSGISQYELMTMLEGDDIDKMEMELQIDDEYLEDLLSTNTNIEQMIIE